MKKRLIVVVTMLALLLSGCKSNNLENCIKFGISAEYLPFEYYANGKLTGFDIELAQLLAKELKKEALFVDLQFNMLLAALHNGSVDAAISTITITTERQQNFDFSLPYYQESLAIIYPHTAPLTSSFSLATKKIACQLGSTMEIWLKNKVPNAKSVVMDNNPQAIEALKAQHVDGVLVDSVQAKAFVQLNPQLAYSIIAQSDSGYGIVVNKGATLKEQLNAALKALSDNGELAKLKNKWLVSE